MQVHRLWPKHLTCQFNQPLVEKQMLEFWGFGHPARRGPLARHTVFDVFEIGVGDARMLHKPPPQVHRLLNVEQASNDDEPISAVGFPQARKTTRHAAQDLLDAFIKAWVAISRKDLVWTGRSCERSWWPAKPRPTATMWRRS